MRFTRRACTWLAPFIAAMLGGASAAAANPKVVASFSLLGDLVSQVGGNDIELVVLAPAGAEVHEWELTPDSFIALEDADLIFYNGYQLEQWMRQVHATVGNRAPLVAVAEASEYPTQPVVTGEYTGEPDPHLWMDPRAVAAYLQVIADQLAELHPPAADSFQARASAAKEKLAALHDEVSERLASIPEERRILITTETAFVYFADAYGFRHDGAWGSNAETEGSPPQAKRLIDLIEEIQPAALFWESTLSDRDIQAISANTGVPTAGPLFVDSLSEPDGDASNYVAMMRHNANLIRHALMQEESKESEACAEGEKETEQAAEGANVSE
ncbi:zinc ABC transporter solute-binding protein [Halomonas sp. MCCC 1A17488]|uniref:Zinc ABC transporter solute-binding protein n=1 Tax=Billgrantia sulfidoxydans TaxID=2733484 RepID=A0ABX7W7R4_9GAMM|nr:MULTISPECIES: zinc ABC transporter substrate-binding protein [Halomonas]MCE8018290.1 zinc ABC transporter solute-binding protein [Halomonas sp. MCCC 1A17488]MCG3241623.1 zinc ABC transporter solute-binding protein [Halomonas sp. MCCC 1A17488]QPP48431.1 zinc ABC transporter substrate-binding protein [Halomonas sp. SS10-MC5]QTP55742.1 zinc ABC transporter solute-binding protein [Halomonas sulfidoxydans]